MVRLRTTDRSPENFSKRPSTPLAFTARWSCFLPLTPPPALRGVDLGDGVALGVEAMRPGALLGGLLGVLEGDFVPVDGVLVPVAFFTALLGRVVPEFLEREDGVCTVFAGVLVGVLVVFGSLLGVDDFADLLEATLVLLNLSAAGFASFVLRAVTGEADPGDRVL